MDTLAESAVIRTAPDADTIKTWNQLTDAEKTSFGNSSANYQYDVYMDNYNNMLDDEDVVEREEQILISKLNLIKNNASIDKYKKLINIINLKNARPDWINDEIENTNNKIERIGKENKIMLII